MSDIRNSKIGPLQLGQSLTIGKMHLSRVRFAALLPAYRNALERLQSLCPGAQVTADQYGHPRVVSNFAEGGLDQVVYFGPTSGRNDFLEEWARQFLDGELTSDLLDLSETTLRLLAIVKLPNNAGFKVVFQHQENIWQETIDHEMTRRLCDVDKSQIEVFVKKSGRYSWKLYRLQSSLCREKVDYRLQFKITESDALYAVNKFVGRRCGNWQIKVLPSSCQGLLNPYRGRLTPIYRVLLNLVVNGQPLPLEAIVLGDSGEVVFAKPQALHAQPKTGVAGRALLNEPNRYQAIANQLKDVTIDTSILRQVNGKYVLANNWIEVHSCQLDENGRRSTQLVTTMPDDGTTNGGTFNWPENTPQAKAVVVYVAYMFLINLAVECGLKIPQGSKVLLVNAADPWNVNNDTFYPQEQEIQDGVGDGNFMRKDMVYDLVPDDHELVHWFVYMLRSIDHYIQGNLGGALNEAIADIVATLVRYLSWLNNGVKLGDELTYDKLMRDMAVIGYYCFVASDKGFREDNNNLVYPDDLHGTNVHDNCRIPAAATLHTFFAMVDNAIKVLQAMQVDKGLEPMSKDQALQFVLAKTIKDFLRLIITAIPMLPAHDVIFSDWRKALEDSDRLIFRGSHTDFIAQGFDRHKIKTNTVVLTRFADFRRDQ